MDKYEKILKLIKAVNDKYPEWDGLLSLVLFDDASGHFECRANYLGNSTENVEEFSPVRDNVQSLDELFIKYGIE